MKKITRLLCVFLAIAMLFSMVACGNTAEEKPVQTEGNVETVEKPEEVVAYDPMGAYEEAVTVEVGRPMEDYGVEIPEGETYVDNSVLDYIKEKLNIDVEYTWEGVAYGDNYTRCLSLTIASGEMPDILWINDEDILRQLVENDLVADLTDVYEQYASDLVKSTYAACASDVLGDRATYDGKLVALPNITYGGLDHFIHIRQDWVDALGLTLDEDGNHLITREELEMVARAFVENDPGNSGDPVGISIHPYLNTDANTAFTSFNHPYGGYYRFWFEEDDGTVTSGSTTPETKEILGWWNHMYEEGLLDPQYGISAWDSILEMVTQNRLGIISGEVGAVSWMMNNAIAADPNAVFAAYALDNGTGKTRWVEYDNINRWIVVSKECEHPEAAIKLLNLFAEMQAHQKEIAAEDSPLADLLNNQEILYSNYYPLYLLSFLPGRTDYETIRDCLNGEMTYDELSLTAQRAYDVYKKYEEDPTSLTVEERIIYQNSICAWKVRVELRENDLIDFVSPIYGITTDTMASKLADLNKLEEETYVKIITGEEPVDYFDTFVEEYNSRGGAAICEELAEILH